MIDIQQPIKWNDGNSELNQITVQTDSLGGQMAQKTLTSWFELVHACVYLKRQGRDVPPEAAAADLF